MSIVDNKSNPPIVEDSDRYRLYPLFPFEAEKRFEVYYLEIDPGTELQSEGHRPNVEEYVFLQAGTLRIRVAESEYTLQAGQSLNFDAGRRHSYTNTGKSLVKAIMPIHYPVE